MLTIPNVVSVIRILLIPAFIWLVLIEETAWAGLLLGVIGATDWIDGYLARKLDQVTEVGKLLDPVADRLAVAVAVVLGLIVGVLPAWLGWGIIVREVLIGIGAVYGWTKGIRRLDVRWLGKTATLLLYFGITAFYLADGLRSDVLWWIALGFGLSGLVLYYAVAVDYVRDMRGAIAGNEGAGESP
ncbi:MAG: CDP-alcohol phosphatidyltransferase family protein [Actinomycetota bacterium]